jgi:hypothetical protein
MTAIRRPDPASRLALFGGTPVRKPEKPRQYPVWSEETKQHVARLLDTGVAPGLSKDQPEIGASENAFAEFRGVPYAVGIYRQRSLTSISYRNSSYPQVMTS